MKNKIILFTIINIMLWTMNIHAEATYSSFPSYRPERTNTPPVIDGALDDDVWSSATVMNQPFSSYSPLFGETLPFETHFQMAYDDENLYFAFHAIDPEPDKIKSSYTPRDQMFSDDWVGFSFDALGTKQVAYELMVNPHGIQADIYDSISNGEDVSPDWVWDSAARITDDGYIVEIRLPFKSIQFASGEHVEMGIILFRKISRIGISGSWPNLNPGESGLNRHAPVILENISKISNIEILPSITFSSNTERQNPESWSSPKTEEDIGVGLSYGITSSTSAELTINPDFSQIESDAFQVDVNRRYPIFYTEKRPFFMEDKTLFNVAGTGGNMNTAVHTRKIVDPAWSAKLTGTEGKTSFGIIAAEDTWNDPNRLFSHLGDNTRYFIARGKYALNKSNYIGGVYSGHDFTGGYNHVAGIDAVYRFNAQNHLTFNTLQSIANETLGDGDTEGNAVMLNYQYSTRRITVSTGFEQYSRDFRMDTAFYNRTGIRQMYGYIAPQFYPDWIPWMKKITPSVSSTSLHDLTTNMDDTSFDAELGFSFTRQGRISISHNYLKEAWADKYFSQSRQRISGSVQARNWLSVSGYFNTGTSIYYDPVSPFIGEGNSYGSSVRLQPGTKFSVSLEYDHSDLDRSSTNSNVYNMDIFNARTVYQFNKYFFIREIVRYNSYRKRLLHDFVASFTYIPGTVIHFGYGGISEKNKWVDNKWEQGIGEMYEMKRSLFFKASYLYRY
ncbi:sugar-binding protein [Candidatus Latescibacterota bacterium]